MTLPSSSPQPHDTAIFFLTTTCHAFHHAAQHIALVVQPKSQQWQRRLKSVQCNRVLPRTGKVGFEAVPHSPGYFWPVDEQEDEGMRKVGSGGQGSVY